MVGGNRSFRRIAKQTEGKHANSQLNTQFTLAPLQILDSRNHLVLLVILMSQECLADQVGPVFP